MLVLLILLAPMCLRKNVYANSLSVHVLDSLLESADSLSSPVVLPDTLPLDSLTFPSDSLTIDTLSIDSVSTKPVGGGLTAVVNYKAQDSLVFAAGNMAWLYGSSQVTYTDITLDAERLQLSLDSSLVHANGVLDTITGRLTGKPVFKDNSGEYQTRTMSYNFKTAKGFICDVTSQQGEGYVTGGITKKMPNNDIYLENGRYTTCDQTECPHFYIELTKGRLRPNKNIVTGPA